MKKIVSVLVLSAVLAAGAYAESLFELDLGYQTLKQSASALGITSESTYTGISLGFRSTSMNSDFLGVATDFSFDFPSREKWAVSGYDTIGYDIDSDEAGLWMDLSVGLAIRLVNSGSVSVFLIPNAGLYCIFPPEDSNEILYGLGLDGTFLYRLADSIGVTAGFDYSYYMGDILNSPRSGVTYKRAMFTPKIGIAFSF